MKHKALSIVLTLLILVTSAIAASAGKETQLTHNERLTSGISFYGNHVYWTESSINYVHAYNLTNGKRTDIDGYATAGKTNSYGNKVVWTGDDGESIYMYDISTGNETKILPNSSFPDIYGNYVVYTNNYYSQDRQSGIYLYDLNTGNETKIAAVHGYPAIYDKKVVWSQANSNNGYDICEYDISTNQKSVITTIDCPIHESELDIYGDTVVWAESNKIYMYDIASHKKTQVTNSGNAHDPAIYGNWIVYAYNPKESFRGNIYAYEISTAKKIRITTSTRAFNPSIYGDKVVYADLRNPENPDVRDIYLYDLSCIK